MKTPQELYKTVTSKGLLKLIIDSGISIKFGQNRFATAEENAIVKIKITALIAHTEREVLLRGIQKSKTKEKLISKLNSNDSLYDGLFGVGEKAKNFLEKSDGIPHPLKTINSIGKATASWIFDTYSNLASGPIDLTFFKDNINKQVFINKMKRNRELYDYYLFGLHTYNSDYLVNFVSTTLAPEVAFHNQTKDKLVIFLWIPKDYTFYINSAKLQDLKSVIHEKQLPILSDSFYPSEKEFSIKGCIFPHIIIGVHDLETNEFIFNPAILIKKPKWLDQGFNIDQSSFKSFIKQTKYQRFLILADSLEEIEVC